MDLFGSWFPMGSHEHQAARRKPRPRFSLDTNLQFSGLTYSFAPQITSRSMRFCHAVPCFFEDQIFSPTLIADEPRTTKSEVAGTLGLGKDAFSRGSRIRAWKTQVHLLDAPEILNRVEAETGSTLAAYVWFREEPLRGFGGATSDLLVRERKADHVHAYLDRIMAGGYA